MAVLCVDNLRQLVTHLILPKNFELMGRVMSKFLVVSDCYAL